MGRADLQTFRTFADPMAGNSTRDIGKRLPRWAAGRGKCGGLRRGRRCLPDISRNQHEHRTDHGTVTTRAVWEHKSKPHDTASLPTAQPCLPQCVSHTRSPKQGSHSRMPHVDRCHPPSMPGLRRPRLSRRCLVPTPGYCRLRDGSHVRDKDSWCKYGPQVGCTNREHQSGAQLGDTTCPRLAPRLVPDLCRPDLCHIRAYVHMHPLLPPSPTMPRTPGPRTPGLGPNVASDGGQRQWRR